MVDRPVGDEEQAIILEEVNDGTPWATVAARHGLSAARIAQLVRDNSPALGRVEFTPPEPAGSSPPPIAPAAHADDPPWEPSAADAAELTPRRYARARRRYDSPDWGDEARPAPGTGQNRAYNPRTGETGSFVPDQVISPGQRASARLSTKRYDPEARRELLDRTFDAYSDLLAERVDEGGMSAKEMVLMAEVFKLLDNQARLSEGEPTDRMELSDNRDRVRESIRLLRERGQGSSAPSPTPIRAQLQAGS